MNRPIRRAVARISVALTMVAGLAVPAWAGTAVLEGIVFDAGSGDPIAGASVVADGPVTGSAVTGVDGRYEIASLDGGSYTVSVSPPCGWLDATVSDVVVIDGVTVTQDVALNADTSTIEATIAVADASGGGWPLYATVTVTGPAGAVTGLTDPITGQRTFDVGPCDAYSVTASALAGGYKDKTVSYAPQTDGAALSIGLQIDGAACTAPGYRFVGLEHDFEGLGGRLPAGWSVSNLGGGGYASTEAGYGGGYDGAYWRTDDPGYRGNLTGGSGGFASLDIAYFYEQYGRYGTTDSTIVTPAIDFTGVGEVWLQFDSDYYGGGTGQRATVLVDPWGTNGAPAGSRVLSSYGSRRTRREVVNISSIAGNAPVIRIQFRGQGVSGNWWQIDNLRVGGCVLNADGLVIGHVTRASTGTPMIGATVSDAHGNTSTTIADGGLGIGDGFFALGSKAGSQAITGTSHGFGDDVQSIPIADGAVVTAAFAVPDDQLLAAPYGSAFTQKATIGGLLGTGPASASATADESSGQLIVDVRASSSLPFGMPIPFTAYAVGAAQGHATARIIERVEVRPGSRTVSASLSLPERRVEAFAREGHSPPVRGARAALWAVISLQNLACDASGCLPDGDPVATQVSYACAPVACGGPTDLSATISSAGFGYVDVTVVVFGMAAVEGNGEASARASGNLLSLEVT